MMIQKRHLICTAECTLHANAIFVLRRMEIPISYFFSFHVGLVTRSKWLLHHVSLNFRSRSSNRIKERRRISLNLISYFPFYIPEHYICSRKKIFLSFILLTINPLSPELNPICYLLALLGAHHFLHVSRIRVKSLTFRLLMSYIYIWSTHS